MNCIKNISVAALLVISFFLISMPVNAAVETTSFEIRGQTANETAGMEDYLDLTSGSVSWGPDNFAGFFYDAADELGNEKLIILDSDTTIVSKQIKLNNLIYTTSGDNKLLNVVKYPFNGNYQAAKAAGLEQFQAGSMSSENGKYKFVVWQGERYVAVKNKTNKLSRLIIEQGPGAREKKTLTVNETWDVGGGWQLTAQAIDAKASPRQVWFVLRKDGIKKDDKVLVQGQIYTYVEKSLVGETDVPLFVTHVDSIFAGSTSDMVQLRYTWAIDTKITEINTGDRYGIFNVTKADETEVELRNSNYPVSLSRNSVVDLMNNLKFRVADRDTLRFYPVIELFEPGIYYVRGQVANETTSEKGYLDLSSGSVSWQPQNFAGFFYDLNDELGKEDLTILNSASLKNTRTIQPDDLIYTLHPENKLLNVVKYPFNNDYQAAAAAGLEQFHAGSMSSENGNYRITGGQGDKYVIIKNNISKLSRFILEQGGSSFEKKTLAVGETWDIGGGWQLTLRGIDAKASPRQAWFELSKDGVKKDDKVLAQNHIYTYVEKSFAGESDVPLFMTYLDSVFAGVTTDLVQVRYTWAIDTNVIQISPGQNLGVFNVTGLNGSMIQFKNSDHSVLLNRASTVDLMDNMKFKVADSDVLRFYPEIEYEVTLEIPGCSNSTINGYNFKDINVNGIRDSGEIGLSNRIIVLKGKNSCTNMSVDMVTRTDPGGYFEFRNVPTGTYLLAEKMYTGWIPTTPGVYKILLPHYSTIMSKDFGNLHYP